MIFLGDVALAVEEQFEFQGFPIRFNAKPLCLNLEGAVLNSGDLPPTYGVYNSHHWVDSFKTWEIGAVFLGNNHIHDVKDGILTTLDFLKLRNISGFGAGETLDAASFAPVIDSGDHRYRLLGFGWSVIGCKKALLNAPGVSPFEEYQVKSSIK